MITELGIVAGEIWHYLDDHGKSDNLESLIKHLNKARDVVLMSAGWLAREGHISLEGEGPDYKITLRK